MSTNTAAAPGSVLALAVKTNLVQKLTFSFAVFISSAFVCFLPTKVSTLRKSSDEPSGGKGSQPPTPKNVTPRTWIQNKKKKKQCWKGLYTHRKTENSPPKPQTLLSMLLLSMIKSKSLRFPFHKTSLPSRTNTHQSS